MRASVCEICCLSQQSGYTDIMLCGLLFMVPGLLWPTSPLSTFLSTHIPHRLQETSSHMCAIVAMGIGHGAETNKSLLLVVCVSFSLWLEKQAVSAHILECFSISECSYGQLWRSNPNNGRKEKDLALPFPLLLSTFLPGWVRWAFLLST